MEINLICFKAVIHIDFMLTKWPLRWYKMTRSSGSLQIWRALYDINLSAYLGLPYFYINFCTDWVRNNFCYQQRKFIPEENSCRCFWFSIPAFETFLELNKCTREDSTRLKKRMRRQWIFTIKIWIWGYFFSFLEKKTQHKMMVMLKLLKCFQCYLRWKKPGDRVSVIPFQVLSWVRNLRRNLTDGLKFRSVAVI